MTAWTRARLERVLRARYGTTPLGAIKLDKAADDLGVSKSTLYRWLRTNSQRSLARVPVARLDQLEATTAVEDYLVTRERDQSNRARWAIAFVRKYGPQELWAAQGWLEPHLVQVVQTTRPSTVRQVTFRRVGEQPAKTSVKRPVKVIEQVEISSRFHAEILVGLVLEKVGPWRVRSTDPSLRVGPTRAWTHAGAPAVHLGELAEQLPRPVAKRRRAEARKLARTL